MKKKQKDCLKNFRFIIYYTLNILMTGLMHKPPFYNDLGIAKT